MGLWKYLARKIEPHLKELICTDVSNSKNIKQQITKSVDSEIAKIENVGLRVLCSVDLRGKTLEGQVNELRGEVNGYSLQVAEALQIVDKSKALVSQASSAADAANARAVSAEESAKKCAGSLEAISSLVKKEETLYASIDELLKKGIADAVKESTVQVNSELRKAVDSLRAEHKDITEEALDRLQEKYADLSSKVKAIIDEGIKKFEETKTKSEKELNDYLKGFEKDIGYIKDNFEFIRKNLPHVLYVLNLADRQIAVLHRLYGPEFKGNVENFKACLNREYSTGNGKKSPFEEAAHKLELNELQDMLNYQAKFRLGGAQNLREVLKRITDWYTWINNRYGNKQN